MQAYCPNCGVRAPEGARFCYACGTPMVDVTNQAMTPAPPEFLRPSGWTLDSSGLGAVSASRSEESAKFIPPAETGSAPWPEFGQPTAPPAGIPMVDIPQPFAAVSQAGPDSDKPRWPIALRILIPGLVTAVLVFAAVIGVSGFVARPGARGNSPGGQIGPTPTSVTPISSAAPRPTPHPLPARNPPLLWCGSSPLPYGYPGWYYTIGNDEIPVLDFSWPQAELTCIGETTVGDTTTLVLHYGLSQLGTGDVVEYVHWMRQDSGFMIGHLESTGGITTASLWRASVDSGMVLRVLLESDSDGCTITVSKGPFDQKTRADFPAPAASAPVGAPIELTPAQGWQLFQTPQGSAISPIDPAQAYAIFENDHLVGTMQVVQETIRGWGYQSSLAAFADAITTSFHPQQPFVQMDTRAEVTIDGRPAIDYTLTWNDLQFRFVFVEVNGAYLSIISAVDVTAGQNLAADVDSMISSARISG